jgi:hypothetical protein
VKRGRPISIGCLYISTKRMEGANAVFVALPDNNEKRRVELFLIDFLRTCTDFLQRGSVPASSCFLETVNGILLDLSLPRPVCFFTAGRDRASP